MRQIKISEGALEDLNEGYYFYDIQDRGLGDYFVSSLRTEIERIRFTAGSHRIVHFDYFRVIAKRFPYGIYYTLSGEIITIWAVLDLRQEPNEISERLK